MRKQEEEEDRVVEDLHQAVMVVMEDQVVEDLQVEEDLRVLEDLLVDQEHQHQLLILYHQHYPTL